MDKTTIVAFAITVVFGLSFVPFLVLTFVTASMVSNLGRTLRGPALVAYNIFQCFPYLNSVANPFIYGALNAAFRAECGEVWQRVTCRRRSGTDESDTSETLVSE
jgi:hypothetical protein